MGKNEKPTQNGPGRIRRLRRAELPADTVELARFLIGKTLVHELPGGRLSGRIVETEAYPPGDAAAHSFRGETPRNRSLFLERGFSYVYFCYGNWFMMNVAGETPGTGAGVLLRAIEPLEGVARMQRRRSCERATDVARGPGRLANAMRIDQRHDGLDLCATGILWLGEAARQTGPVRISPRIGITRETGRLLRFYEGGNPCVSGPRRMRE
jgi:DNA-3-methyladenine glycosylase